MPLQLVPLEISPNLLQAAMEIVEGIQAGEIVGLGLVVMLRHRKYFVDAFGELARYPHEARGLVASLDDALREMAGSHRVDWSATH